MLVFAGFHLHLLGDLMGSKGPDGSQWPIPYLLPFSADWQLTWSGQWELNAWQNITITALAIAAMFGIAIKKGFSPIGLISEPADSKFVATLRARFCKPGSDCTHDKGV